MASAAIRFELEGYDLNQPRLMGRQAAGHAFLRAAVAGREGPVVGYGPDPRGLQAFGPAVAAIDPAAEARWLQRGEAVRLAESGVLYLPGPDLATEARLRLRHGPAHYSLCGVTHTTASFGASNALASLLSEPVAPWDAVICTSDAVAETARRIHEAQADYLRWRLGPQVRLSLPQLPVIPLGVHCDDFVFSEAERRAARLKLGLKDDDVLALFVGRIAFIGKAHPLAMYRALQAVAGRTGRSLALMQCGWAPTPQIDNAFREAAREFAPDVRCLFADGRIGEIRRECWAAADLFISLSDNIQETFGLTPLEAMAAGLPVVVTDWNGYRQTVHDGEHGFRIPTFAPSAPFGAAYAHAYEAEQRDYDRYCWATVAATSIDMPALIARITDLVESPDLRRRMGEAGRATARADFDWPIIFARYQALWAELNSRRQAAAADPDQAQWLMAAPRADAARLDPFHAFGHYPTRQISLDARLVLAPGASEAAYRRLAGHVLFIQGTPPEPLALGLLALLQSGPATVAQATGALRCPPAAALLAAAVLAKMDLIRLEPPAA
jgi:alpha-maltose-1-phosphate synthase